MNVILRLLMLAAVLDATGCDTERQPPMPYAVMPRDANILGEILGHPGVEVMPPDGVSPAVGAQLAGALAAALQEEDIPALMGKELSGGHQIRGEVKIENGSVVINWLLYKPDGEELAGVEVRDALGKDADPDKPLEPEVLQALTSRAVTALVLHFPAAGGQLEPDMKVFVADIEGVPGDGGKSLPRELRSALRAAGMNVATAAEAGALRIEGQVQITEQGAGQLVALSWRVLDSAGKEIGHVDQSNPVAAGRLEGNWGDIAFGAAAGAEEGIIPLLEDYRAETSHNQKD
ncbi:MAG: hypothetical protein EXR08_06725 [Alphaproteobacteria bacterium]|nr:hypothetical protein [Alphaproteobacteria bacterium]